MAEPDLGVMFTLQAPSLAPQKKLPTKGAEKQVAEKKIKPQINTIFIARKVLSNHNNLPAISARALIANLSSRATGI